MSKDESIFSKIIDGTIPCHRIYEDSKTIAFLDLHPIQPGMVLVVSKNQVDHFMDLPEPDYLALMLTVRLVSQKMHSVFAGKRIGVAIEGFEVPHAHVKLFPVASGPEFRAEPPTDQPNHAELSRLAKILAL